MLASHSKEGLGMQNGDVQCHIHGSDPRDNLCSIDWSDVEERETERERMRATTDQREERAGGGARRGRERGEVETGERQVEVEREAPHQKLRSAASAMAANGLAKCFSNSATVGRQPRLQWSKMEKRKENTGTGNNLI